MEKPSRLVSYTRWSISANVSTYEDGIPGLAIHTAQSSFGFLYSQFTDNAYNQNSNRLSDKERRLRVIDFLDWFNGSAKLNSYILGDTNIDWANKSSFSRRAIATWCLDARFTQMVDSPTRLKSILDYCLVRSNKLINCETIDSGFSDHMAIALKIDSNPVIFDSKKIYKWNITQDLIQRACLNQVVWNAADTVESFARKITDWLKFYQTQALSVKTVNYNPFKKD